jgi:hypothetical protein
MTDTLDPAFLANAAYLAELKKWAFDCLQNWGVKAPDDGGPLKFCPWNLTERMEKADELVAWLLRLPKMEQEEDEP